MRVKASAIGLFFSALAAVFAGKPIPAHYSKIVFPNWSYEPPRPGDYRVELPGGAVAYLVPDSALDVVKVSLFCRRINMPRSPAETAPLNLYSSLLKDGGTLRFSPDQLEDSLEFIAASLSASLSDFQSTASFDVLGKNTYDLMGLMSEVALKPRLDNDVFKEKRRELLEGLKHRYDTPRAVMGVAYERVLQGVHPSNWMPTEKEVEAVTVKQLSAFSGSGFTRQGLVLGVSGRFDRNKMLTALKTLVEQFPAGNAADTAAPKFKGPLPPGVYLVDKAFSQATIRLGSPGVRRPHPDYYRLVVASYVFGDGGFTSRLMERVRSNEGLAYGIGSEVESDYHRTGTVYVGLQTKAPTGAYAVKLVLEEMRKMADKGITDEELNKAKEGLLRSLPSLFDTPANTASIFAQGEVWGRALDHYSEYQKTLQAMTRKEVEEAFRKYFHPDSLRIILVGPKNVLLAKDEIHQVSLSDFGKIREITLEELDKRE